MSQNKPIQGSKEWHAWRRARITSTDAYHIMQGSIKQWYELWLYKTEGEQAEVNTAATNWGQLNEDIARTEYNEKTGLFTLPTLASREVNGVPVGTSLDGQDCLDKTKIVEIKCPYSRPLIQQLKDASGDLKTVEPAYWMQCQHHMLAVDTETCDFFVWTQDETYCITIEADRKFLSAYLDKMESFWEYVRLKSPPINFIATDTWESLEEEYKEAYAQEKHWLAKKLKAQQALIELANDQPSKGKSLTLYKTKRIGAVDTELMIKTYGIDKEAYRKPDTWYWRITQNG